MSKVKNMSMGTESIACVVVSDELLVPEVLMDSPRIDEFIAKAQEILSCLPPEAKMVPWIIGSTDRNVVGEPRQSKSHQEGRAFDMSPCYSADELVPADRRIMGMAWNLVSLYTISAASCAALFCAEGDHLHVMVDGQPCEECVFAVPTVATWYPMAETLSLLPAGAVLNKLFIFSDATLRPAVKEEAEKFTQLFS